MPINHNIMDSGIAVESTVKECLSIRIKMYTQAFGQLAESMETVLMFSMLPE